MRFSRNNGKVAGAISFLVLAFGASVCRADCEHVAYAYEDRVVVQSCNKASVPELRVVVLDDTSPLKVTGRVEVPSQRSFDIAAHYNNFLLLVRYDKFEVYDLADPAHPNLAANFVIKKRESAPGSARIEQTATNKFVVMTGLGVVEVTAEGEPSKWGIAEIPMSKELQKKMSGRPPEWRFWDQNEHAVVVRETPKFRYELVWREKSSTGEILHRQYLRKVDITTQQAASELLLGQHLETID
jgi:hypothetical protein